MELPGEELDFTRNPKGRIQWPVISGSEGCDNDHGTRSSSTLHCQIFARAGRSKFSEGERSEKAELQKDANR